MASVISRPLWILVLKYETFTMVQQKKLLLLELVSIARSQKVSQLEISLCVCVCVCNICEKKMFMLVFRNLYGLIS